MTQSQWNLPTNVIPIATIEATLKGFLDVLHMTRTSKFTLWHSSTTEKSWRWGDSIVKLRDSIDSVQLEIVVGKMEKINIDFIDTNPRNVIIDPYLTLLKAILSSPLLPLCNNRVLILQSCYRESTKRIGQDRSQEIFCQIFSDVQLSINSNLNSNNEDFSGVSNDDIYLSTQLITSLCRHRDINDNSLIQSTIIDKLKNIIENDSASLRLLCIGINLPPITLYCTSGSTFEANSTCVSTNSVEAKLGTPTLEMFSEMNRNEQLWQIIAENLEKDVDRFLCLDKDLLRNIKNVMNNRCMKRKMI